ncbi:hypothetical protein HYPSUDRAFT_59221 [Hypholoma sublateritium FD-334 SS-4]|uniref:DUF7918 domain-containing protein n=1 Tax=Hypholoma sublateritium (strain FD-334 SS-4) TaxID=945553 RepID=A0A0D2NDN7_HYPSF|nr:hypothetical protein HYPSUDRAFT_59221 [Hypholoma sublateritium FD-334 SS-4]
MADVTEKHMVCNNFEAWISIDNTALTQYGEEHSVAGDEASCWIASQTDQGFSVSYNKKAVDEFDYLARVYLDGILVQSTIYVGASAYLPHTASSIRISKTECRGFVFGAIQLSEDDTHLENGPQDVGEIRIAIIKAKAESTPKIYGNPVLPIPNAAIVHERAKMGLGHHVKYQNVIPPAQDKAHRYFFKKELLGTVATFVFKYRPLALLQANGIAPRTPQTPDKGVEVVEIPISPLPVDSPPQSPKAKVDVSHEEDADTAAILARERVLLAELEQIRMTKRAAGISKDRRLKKKLKQNSGHFFPGEIVDLT